MVRLTSSVPFFCSFQTISLTLSSVTTTTKSAMMAPANSSLVCRLPITAKLALKIRSYCPTLLPQAIAALLSTLAKVAGNWNTHRKKYLAQVTKTTSTAKSARKVSAASGSSYSYLSYRSLLQEELDIGSGPTGVANLGASGLVIQGARLMQISRGSHGPSRQSAPW